METTLVDSRYADEKPRSRLPAQMFFLQNLFLWKKRKDLIRAKGALHLSRRYKKLLVKGKLACMEG